MIRIVMRHLDIVTFATQTIQLRWIVINAWQNACLLSIYGYEDSNLEDY